MELKAKFDRFSYATNGDIILSFICSEKHKIQKMLPQIQNKELDLTIEEHKETRSLSANSYMWVLLDELAKMLRTTKEELYQNYIKKVGIFQDVPISEKAVKTLIHVWQAYGLGWFTEIVEEGDPSTLRLYYGSSSYNKKQMARLINEVVQDCKENGIETRTPEELAKLIERWKGA